MDLPIISKTDLDKKEELEKQKRVQTDAGEAQSRFDIKIALAKELIKSVYVGNGLSAHDIVIYVGDVTNLLIAEYKDEMEAIKRKHGLGG